MKSTKISALFVVLFVLWTNQMFGQSLSEELKILEPMLNKTWKGDLKSPDGKQTWQTTREFIQLWDGTIVKYKSSTPARNSYSEGFFYWDRTEEKVAVFIVSKRGVYQNGFVSVEDGILTFRGKMNFPDRSFDYRNTLEMTDDGKLVDKWFQNAFGSWMAGHVIELSAE